MWSLMCVRIWKMSLHSHQRWRWKLRSTCTDTRGKSPACLSANPTASSSVSAKMAPVSCGTSTGQCVSVFLCVMRKVKWCFLQRAAFVWSLSCSCVVFRLCYVQSLTGHKSPVTAVSASETTGDIATVCDSGEDPLRLYQFSGQTDTMCFWSSM